MRHVHSCPRCYEHPVCTMACTIEPDLGTTPDGTPYGHSIACDRCGAPEAADELVDEFRMTLESHGFAVDRDAELREALQRVRRALATHHAPAKRTP